MCRDVEHGGRRCPNQTALNSAQRRVTRLETALGRPDLTPTRRDLLTRRLIDALDRQLIAVNTVHSPVVLPPELTCTGADLHAQWPRFRTTLPGDYSPNRVRPIINRERARRLNAEWDGPLMKPTGGLWSAPVYPGNGQWPPVSAWAVRMGYDSDFDMRGVVHDVSFTSDARVVVIDSWEAYTTVVDACGRDVPAVEGLRGARRGIDFERLPADVLFVTDRAIKEGFAHREDGTYEDMTPWDLTSALILHKRCITVTTEDRPVAVAA